VTETTWFTGKKAILFGGMGFIGSNLALRLVEQGCHVTIVDAMIPSYGGNLFNIEPIKNQVTVNFADIRDQNVMDYLVQGQDVIFHLARQVDHVLSLKDPFPDIDINVRGTAVLLEACRRKNLDAIFVHVGTRGQYGPSANLPVDETAPSKPRGLHEISSLTAENMVEMYHRVHGLRGILLRLTNIYGPRAQMRHPRYGVVNWFVRLALENKPIQVFGDGQILRDFL
jgi:UDP-glucose 4-epimerase